MIGVVNMRLLTSSVKKWELKTYTLCPISHSKMELSKEETILLWTWWDLWWLMLIFKLFSRGKFYQLQHISWTESSQSPKLWHLLKFGLDTNQTWLISKYGVAKHMYSYQNLYKTSLQIKLGSASLSDMWKMEADIGFSTQIKD